MRKIILFILLVSCFSARSQDSILVTKNFHFEDGLYANFDALKNNQPTMLWEEVTATYFSNPRSLTTQVSELILKETESEIDPQKFFAVCIDGMPYIGLKESIFDKKGIFAGLKVRGEIGYFSYEKTAMEKVKIQAYNPANGKPFRTGFVEKEKTNLFEKILIWNTGEQVNFTQKNLLRFIKNDKPLSTSVEELREWEIEEKLFKCLLIYNDRHSVYTKRNESN